MSRRSSRFSAKGADGSFHLQITSMVDIFVIILVFLLKGFSTSAIDLAPSSEVVLPASSSTKPPTEMIKLIISKNGIFVDDKKVAEVSTGKVNEASLDKTDPSFIRPLYEELDRQAQKTRSIAQVNETVEFDGQILVQADRGLPYSLIKKVMYTSMMAGYADAKLAVLSPE